MENEEKEIVLRTEEVNEILSKPPSWLVRWGISVIFIMLCCFVALSWLIEYPDTLLAKATVTSQNPPITIIAKGSGKLQKLYIQNNSKINKHTIIGVLENTANEAHVISLEKNLLKLKTQIRSNLDTIKQIAYFSDTLVLGDITPNYYQFLKALKDYQLFLETDQQQRQISLLDKELNEYSGLKSKLNKQTSIQQQELNLVKSDFDRSKILYESKTISTKEFEVKKMEYLAAQRNIENQNITLSNTNITINNISKNKLQLQIQQYEAATNFKNALNQNLKSLEANIEQWKKNYLLQSPIEGNLSFINLWKENQDVKVGDQLFIISPPSNSVYIAKLLLPSANSGKVKVGQKVNIQLDNFNASEYGVLNGEVTNISAIAINNNFSIDVNLKDGLTTSYHQKLSDKDLMTGNAQIITERRKLFHRIVSKFRDLMNKK
jgi:multidrug efflux pump subunit AcrA (membrane-fusion protein)